MMIYSGGRVRLARFCRAKIRAGCCPGFRESGWIFRVFLESSCIRCHSLSTFSECCISIYFFEINDVINDVSTFISYPCRIIAVMFIVWPS